MLTFLSWFENFLNINYFQNNGTDYIRFILIFLISFLFFKIIKNTLLFRFNKNTEKNNLFFNNLIFEIISSFNIRFYFFLSLYISSQFLTIPNQIINFYNLFFFIIFAIYFSLIVQKIIHFIFQENIKKQTLLDTNFDSSVVDLIEKVLVIIIWFIIIVILLQNFGFNVTTLIGGLGIGGIAIAFAMQNVLSDIFASVSIFFDKPFKTGDFITVGTDIGTVEKIGIKSTRLRSLDGELIVISNRELTETRIKNIKQMKTRRVVFKIQVSYTTTSQKLKQIKKTIIRILEKQPKVEVERVNFLRFGDFALEFEVVYIILTKNYQFYVDTQENINLEIKKALEELKVEIPFPTQNIYIKS